MLIGIENFIISHKRLSKLIETAKAVPLENVTTFKDIEEEVTDFVQHGFKPGYQIGLQNFDRIFKTNPIAKEVRTPKYKSRVVKSKKGKGSFKRVKLDKFDNL